MVGVTGSIPVPPTNRNNDLGLLRQAFVVSVRHKYGNTVQSLGYLLALRVPVSELAPC